jgi:hypothetical protein
MGGIVTDFEQISPISVWPAQVEVGDGLGGGVGLPCRGGVARAAGQLR